MVDCEKVDDALSRSKFSTVLSYPGCTIPIVVLFRNPNHNDELHPDIQISQFGVTFHFYAKTCQHSART